MKLNFLDSLLLALVPRTASIFSNIMGHTTKLNIIGPPGMQTRHDMFYSWPRGVIYCIWHSRFFYFSYFGRGKDVFTMISPSNDGELITRTIHHMRLYAVRGSSSKRGHEALQEAVSVLEHNHKLFMLPDGPHGPRHKVKAGTVRIAQLAGRPILPMGFSTTSGIFLPSWDRFLLPLPFGKAVLLLGQPIYVPNDISSDGFNATCQQLESTLHQLHGEADRLCGRDPDRESQKFAWLRKRKKRKAGAQVPQERPDR